MPPLPIIPFARCFPSATAKRRVGRGHPQESNKLCCSAVRGFSQVNVLETWKLFADAKGDAKLVEFPDLLHPKQARLCEMGGGVAATPRDRRGSSKRSPKTVRTRAGIYEFCSTGPISRAGVSAPRRTCKPTASFTGTGSTKQRYRARSGRLHRHDPSRGADAFSSCGRPLSSPRTST